MNAYDPLDHIIHLRDGTLQESDLRRIVGRALQARSPSGIVIHIHGGRVSQKRGRRIAEALHDPYVRAQAYPLFFVWETGDIEAPLNNLGEILGAVLAKLLFRKVHDKILEKLGDGQVLTPGMKILNAAPPDEESLSADLAQEFADDPEVNQAIAEAREDYREATLAPANKMLAHEPPAEHAAIVNERTARELFGTPSPNKAAALNWIALAIKVARLVIRVWQRQHSGRGRPGAVSAVIVEEVLREFYLDDVGRIGWWNPMKKDAQDSFDGPASGGVRFLRELHRQLQSEASVPRITLVGHSAGSIFLCELLDQAAQILPDLTFDLILEAPAVTCRRFAHAISKHENRIGRFRQLAMRDADEASERSLFFPGSLLYIVSNIFEDAADEPLLGMERFFTRESVYRNSAAWADISACQAFFARKGESAVSWWTLDDLNADQREGWGHGYFDDGPFILGKVTALISETPHTP